MRNPNSSAAETAAFRDRNMVVEMVEFMIKTSLFRLQRWMAKKHDDYSEILPALQT
jgi:hypothetical protein